MASKLFSSNAKLVILLEFKMFLISQLNRKLLMISWSCLTRRPLKGHFTVPLLTLNYL